MSDRFDALADRLASEVVEQVRAMLEQRDREPEPLMDAAAAARFLGVDRSAVYAMAKDGRLPAIRLGDSDRPRLRFDRRALLEHLAVEPHKPQTNGHRRPRGRDSRVPLLPIAGDS
jgi:excisionase family DNA binding protein